MSPWDWLLRFDRAELQEDHAECAPRKRPRVSPPSQGARRRGADAGRRGGARPGPRVRSSRRHAWPRRSCPAGSKPSYQGTKAPCAAAGFPEVVAAPCGKARRPKEAPFLTRRVDRSRCAAGARSKEADGEAESPAARGADAGAEGAASGGGAGFRAGIAAGTTYRGRQPRTSDGDTVCARQQVGPAWRHHDRASELLRRVIRRRVQSSARPAARRKPRVLCVKVDARPQRCTAQTATTGCSAGVCCYCR